MLATFLLLVGISNSGVVDNYRWRLEDFAVANVATADQLCLCCRSIVPLCFNNRLLC